MKVGSIVECVDNVYTSLPKVVLPVKGKKYIIRNIFRGNFGGILVLLEELVNPINQDSGNEFGYDIKYFREIQLPDDLTEQIQECLTREFQLI